MYRKRVFIGLLIGWSIVLALSVYAIKLRNDLLNISGAAVSDIKPIADAYLTLILIFSAVIFLLVGLYFSIQHKEGY